MSKFIENIASFQKSIVMPGGYLWNWPETIKTIDAYSNARFTTGEIDNQGFRKYFFNVVKPAYLVSSKFIDLDLKDVLFYPALYSSEWPVWIMQREFSEWAIDTLFSQLLNDIGDNYPKYGTVILKKVNGKLEMGNLQNFRFDIGVKSLKESEFVYELHRMSIPQIERMGWSSKGLPTDQKFINVFETYEYLDGNKWGRKVLADPFRKKSGSGFVRVTEAEINLKDDFVPGITLAEDEIEFPYRDLYWEKAPGRLPGIGVVEDLFENQIADNEAENLERKALYHKSLQLYQTRDETIGKNVFTSHENGDILKVNSEVTPVQKDNSDLAAFNNTRIRWTRNTEQKAFSFDIARGEELPSRTPLGVARLSAGMVASFFDKKRENFGLFLKDILLNDVVPEFINKHRKIHSFAIRSSDVEIEKYDRAVAASLVSKELKKLSKSKTILSINPDILRETVEKVSTELKERKIREIEIPNEYYKNAKYHLKIELTGEEIDVGTRTQTLTVALQILGSNPMIIQNKATRTLFFKLLELSGIPPVELGALETTEVAIPQGGSIALPAQAPSGSAINSQLAL